MEEFDPVVIQAYPSAILFLARHLDSSGRRYKGRALKSVVTSSETVTDEHRELVCRAFGCRIFDSYGSLERMARILTCEHGNYHVMSDLSYTELIPQGDGTCEVIGTTFACRCHGSATASTTRSSRRRQADAATADAASR